MKKLLPLLSILALAFSAPSQTFEQPQSFILKNAPHFNITSSSRITNPDTTGLQNTVDFLPAFDTAYGHPTLYTFGPANHRTGYLYGNNGSPNGFNEVAQGYQNVNHNNITITGILCWFGAKQSDLGSSATSKLIIKVYDIDSNRAYNIRANHFNVDTLNFPGPSTWKASADILFSTIDTVNYTYVAFTTPPWIWASSDFAIGCSFDSLAAGDTVGLISDKKNDAFNLDYAFHHTSAGKWIVSDELFSGIAANGGLDNDIALWAVIAQGTGVNEFYNSMKLTAYPNPAVDNSTIEYALEKDAKNVSLMVIDPTGKKIMENKYGNQSTGKYTIPLSTNNMASGTYFYQLRANGRIFTKQFIVSK